MSGVGRALLLLCLLAPAAAEAAGPYDPEVPYRTLDTPHFRVMYPEGYGHLAFRTALIAEDARPSMVRRYGWDPPDKINIIIDDQTDYANGSATIFPNKVITLYVTAPTRISGLEEYDDWLVTVLIHEMSHIFHIDMAYGLPWLGRLFFGKYVSMNAYTPSWVTEGLAVYEETVSSGTGRGRSSYVDMVMRAAALEDKFPPIDQGYRGYPNWPFTNVSYFFGGRFQLWLAEKYGEDALLEYHRTYATDPIPFFTYLPAKIVFGRSIESLWDEFTADAEREAVRELELVQGSSLAVTVPERLTRHGGEAVGPRVTPDGQHVVYSASSPIDGPRVWRIKLDGSDDQHLVNDTLSQAISFTPDGRAFYFQQGEINQRFYFHNSLYRYDLLKDEVGLVDLAPGVDPSFRAASGSLRARDPDVSSDGQQLTYVWTEHGANALVVAKLDTAGLLIEPQILVPATPDVQLAGPRFSPDGQRIAVARMRGGRRDIVLYDREGRMTEVTRDRAQDTDPTWSPDGRYLVWSSDRTGIYNLYAWDRLDGRVRQLSNFVTGGFQPSVSPDGRTIVFRGYTAEGFDIFKMPFAPEAGLVVEVEKEPEVEVDTSERAWPLRRADAPLIPPPVAATQSDTLPPLPESWSDDPYSSLSTLLPFHDNWNLFPAIGANEREVFGSLTHFGTDARQTQSYLLSLTYGTLTQFLGGGAAYTNDVLEPTFRAIATAEAVSYTDTLLTFSDPNQPCPFQDAPLDLNDGRRVCNGSKDGLYNERQLAAQLSVGLPVLQRHFFSLSYIFEHRQALDALPEGTITELLPRAGNFARVQLGYTYANVRAFPYSVSLERGPSFGVALSALSRGLGSDYEQLLLTSEGRYYLDLPFRAKGISNHVLATRLGVGVGLGPDLAQLFRLGGVGGASALTTTTENFYSLRGLAVSSLRGTAVISGSTEYRAPIVRIDRGIGTLPFTARVIHGAVFADYGRVFDRLTVDALKTGFFDELAVGVGAELRADVILFYSLPLTLRLGYAYPVKAPASLDPTLKAPGVYFQLGSLF